MIATWQDFLGSPLRIFFAIEARAHCILAIKNLFKSEEILNESPHQSTTKKDGISEALLDGPKSMDALVALLGKSTQDLSIELFKVEFNGRIVLRHGMYALV